MAIIRNYLHGTSIYLNQRTDMFRVNSDTYLLGTFMDVREGDVVLDVGTNNGALLLYASQHQPSHLVGIDVWEEACLLARENLADNQIENFEVHCVPLQEFDRDVVDVVVCNPPYFPLTDRQNVNENEFLGVARHEVSLNLAELGQHSARLLKDRGRLYLVHRSSRLVDLIQVLDASGLGIQRVKFVFDVNKEFSTAILIEAIKGVAHKVQIEKPIVLTR